MEISHYVINLDSQKERWERMQKISEDLHFPLTRVQAINAAEINGKDVFSSLHRRFLTKGEVACFFSHRKIWELISNQSAPFAFVFEDDVVISPKVCYLENYLLSGEIDFDIIHLEDPRKSNQVITDLDSVKDINGIRLGRLLSEAYCTGAMVISKKGAKKLLRIRKPSGPVDEILFNKFSSMWRKLKTYQTFDVLAWQLDTFDIELPPYLISTIEAPRKVQQQRIYPASRIWQMKMKFCELCNKRFLKKFKTVQISISNEEKPLQNLGLKDMK